MAYYGQQQQAQYGQQQYGQPQAHHMQQQGQPMMQGVVPQAQQPMHQQGAAPQQAQPAEQVEEGANPQQWGWQPYALREQMKLGNVESQWRDKGWAIAFIVVVLAMTAIAIFGGTRVQWKDDPSSSDDVNPNFGKYVKWITYNVLWASAFGIVFAFAWNQVMKYNAGKMIKLSIYISLGLQILSFFGIGGFMFIKKQDGGYIPMIVGALMIGLQCLYYYCVWKKIPFSEQMLEISTHRLSHYWQLGWIALGFGFLSALWCFIVAFAGVGFAVMSGADKKRQEGESNNSGYLGIPMFFILCWGGITLSYILHAVACGVMGTWYFGTSRKRTIRDSLKRALTTSLGSLAFGGAIVAAIRTLKFMVAQARQQARQDGNMGCAFVMCCLEAIIQCIGEIIDYINHLAVVRVAVYGEAYCTAAKRTMQLFKYRGLDPLINDDLSNMPVWLGCMVCWIVCIPVNYLAMRPTIKLAGLTEKDFASEQEDGTTPDKMNSAIVWAFAAAFAIVAAIMAAQILTVISSFVQALYVCWADDPATLDATHPEEARKIKEAVLREYDIKIRYDDANFYPGNARL